MILAWTPTENCPDGTKPFCLPSPTSTNSLYFVTYFPIFFNFHTTFLPLEVKLRFMEGYLGYHTCAWWLLSAKE